MIRGLGHDTQPGVRGILNVPFGAMRIMTGFAGVLLLGEPGKLALGKGPDVFQVMRGASGALVESIENIVDIVFCRGTTECFAVIIISEGRGHSALPIICAVMAVKTEVVIIGISRRIGTERIVKIFGKELEDFGTAAWSWIHCSYAGMLLMTVGAIALGISRD